MSKHRAAIPDCEFHRGQCRTTRECSEMQIAEELLSALRPTDDEPEGMPGPKENEDEPLGTDHSPQC